jgi:hypothetical protein
MTGFLPDYSMKGTENAKRPETLKRQKLFQQAAGDPRLNPELQRVAELTAQGLGGAEVNPLDAALAGKAQGQAFQQEQAAQQGALKQVASGRPGQPLDLAPQDPRNVAAWTKFVRGGPQYLPQY